MVGGALAWTMPAQSVARLVNLPPQVHGLHGHLRAGGASLVGGYKLDWTVTPGALLLGRLAATARLSGADTELTGEFAASLGGVVVRNLQGRAGAGLLQLLNGTDLACDSRATLNVGVLRFGGGRAEADGRIDIAEGMCSAGGQSAPLPAAEVTLTSDSNDALAVIDTQAGVRIGSARATGDRRMILRLEPEGAAMIPGAPSSAPTILEIPF